MIMPIVRVARWASWHAALASLAVPATLATLFATVRPFGTRRLADLGRAVVGGVSASLAVVD